MATKQLHKTVNAAAVTKTAIDQKQSLEVIQTMFHGALSTLSYLRHFFRNEAFDQRVFCGSDSFQSYADFAAGRLVQAQSTANARKTRMMILRRGRSKRADTFLDWLENGVFRALQEGSLDALQIYVHPSSTDRRKVIEYYTFTVTYLLEADGISTPTGLLLKSSSKPSVTVEATNAAIQALLAQIMEISKGLPRLPETKFMSMQLFYRHDVVVPSKPLGWIESTSDDLMFGESEDWKRRNQEVEELRSGFHRASITISHLRNTSLDSGNEDETIPSSLEYNKTSYKRVDISTGKTPSQHGHESLDDGTPSTIVDVISEVQSTLRERRESDANNTPMSHPDTSGTILDEPIPPPKVSGHRTVNRFSKTRSRTSLAGNDFDTQSSNVPEMTKTLHGMMRPEQLTQGDTQIFGQSHPARAKRDGSSDLKPTRSDIASKSTKLILSEAAIKTLDNARDDLRSKAQRLARANGKNRGRAEPIVCQCGCDAEDGHMVFCAYCETWQHLACYGFTSDKDPRIPNNHACYQCVLGGLEEDTLQRLVELAQRRRAMCFFLMNGFKNELAFTSETGLPGATFVPLTKHLKSQRYLVAAKNSRKAGFATSGQPSWVAVREGPNHEAMLKDLFDPLTNIGHHYDLSTGAAFPLSELSAQLLELQEKTMPPPVTPASKTKKAPQRPGTVPDSFSSSSRLLKRKHSASNNGRDPIDVEGSQPKRRATPIRNVNRPMSLQTQLILDIDGDTFSSPAVNHR